MAINLSDISFYYKKHHSQILKIPEWKLTSKSKIFIQGASGTGKTTFLSIALMMSSFIFAQEVVMGLGAVTESSAEVTIDTPFDVGGFQFDAVGAALTAGEGGLAADAGFTVSTGCLLYTSPSPRD